MQIDISGVPVYIGIPVYGRIPTQTALSLASTTHQCGLRALDVEIGMMGRGIVHWARDMVLDGFLKSNKQKLFWIDSDVVWDPDAFFYMVALSTMHDVVCGAYPMKKDGDLQFQVAGTGEAQAMSEHGLFEIHGTGLGFTIMDRSVCEQLAAKAPLVFDQYADDMLRSVFRTDVVDGKRRGEDIAFFADIRELGHKVMLAPAIKLGHVGDKCWQGRALDEMEKAE
jgi:hypothetical protein